MGESAQRLPDDTVIKLQLTDDMLRKLDQLESSTAGTLPAREIVLGIVLEMIKIADEDRFTLTVGGVWSTIHDQVGMTDAESWRQLLDQVLWDLGVRASD